MKLYLIRHGQTYLNKYDKMQGWSDSPLTQEGIIVAEECADKLKLIRFDAMYSSDLGRTIATAKIISRKNESLREKKLIKMRAFRESFLEDSRGHRTGKLGGKLLRPRDIQTLWNFSIIHPCQRS